MTIKYHNRQTFSEIERILQDVSPCLSLAHFFLLKSDFYKLLPKGRVYDNFLEY